MRPGRPRTPTIPADMSTGAPSMPTARPDNGRHPRLLDIGTGIPRPDGTTGSRVRTQRHRSRAKVARFFDGLDMTGPGLVPVQECRPRPARRPGRGRPCGAASAASGRPQRATVGRVRVATWNVNSVKQRVPRLLPWLDQRQPDVVCLQETKLADDAFTKLLGSELAGRGYTAGLYGQAQWNGVAILSRVGLDDVTTGIDGAPGFPAPEGRAVAATCGGVRLHSVYVPNGRVPNSDHYHYKLAWLAALRDAVATDPGATMVCGDMNIAPADADVFDPDAYVGQTHVTPPARAPRRATTPRSSSTWTRRRTGTSGRWCRRPPRRRPRPVRSSCPRRRDASVRRSRRRRQVVGPEPAGSLDRMQNSLPSGSASVIQPLPSGRR